MDRLGMLQARGDASSVRLHGDPDQVAELPGDLRCEDISGLRITPRRANGAREFMLVVRNFLLRGRGLQFGQAGFGGLMQLNIGGDSFFEVLNDGRIGIFPGRARSRPGSS